MYDDETGSVKWIDLERSILPKRFPLGELSLNGERASTKVKKEDITFAKVNKWFNLAIGGPVRWEDGFNATIQAGSRVDTIGTIPPSADRSTRPRVISIVGGPGCRLVMPASAMRPKLISKKYIERNETGLSVSAFISPMHVYRKVPYACMLLLRS